MVLNKIIDLISQLNVFITCTNFCDCDIITKIGDLLIFMQELKMMWQRVLDKIEKMVSAISYDLWISPVVILEFKDLKTLVLVANSTTAKNQLNKNHSAQLKECIDSVFGGNIDFIILDQQEKEEYLQKNKPDTNQSVVQDIDDEEDKSMFNPKYTFDNFVVGKSNQFCYAAARAVAENPGQKFNPLFIYGGVGLGKTHLLHAIGNYIKQTMPKLKIKYITSEKFTNSYIESLGNKGEKGIIAFREKYRNLDILMVDDIQFISKKISTQEEFFHTFNELYQANKQIIISSDRPPKEIETLEDRLRSRFASGLIQDVQVPDFETRIAILRKKSQLERYFIDEDVIEFIADKVDTNIREMEGLLSKVYFFATLLGKKTASIDEAREAFKEQRDVQKEKLTPEKIVQIVCDYFDLEFSEITGKKKSKDIVEPRMYAIYLINDLIDIPLISIGKLFGGRDHTTIIHSRDKISELMKTDQKTKVLITELQKKISENC